jgi:tetratricopeptide (TPR) repeat protein
MIRLVTIIGLLVASTATAGPFKETLSRADRDAIVQAIQSALPKVDKTAFDQCRARYDPLTIAPDTDPDTAADAAACYRKAGNLGLAISSWKLVRQRAPRSKLKPEMVRELAVTYEAAADFRAAAIAYEDYIELYYENHQFTPGGASPSDAGVVLTRAACIYRQLGEDLGARRATEKLVRIATRKTKTVIDPDTMCDQVRPIAMPAKTP